MKKKTSNKSCSAQLHQKNHQKVRFSCIRCKICKIGTKKENTMILKLNFQSLYSTKILAQQNKQTIFHFCYAI